MNSHEEEGEINSQGLERLSKTIKPIKTKTKKGKKFADAAFMLALVDQVNKKQETKIQGLLERNAEELKRMTSRERSRSYKKDEKRQRMEKMKDKLRNQKKTHGGPSTKSDSKGRGDHRKNRQEDEGNVKKDKASFKKQGKKKVSFR